MPLVVIKRTCHGLLSDLDIVAARRAVTDGAKQVGLSLLDGTKIVTAASEIARNTVVYGKGGDMAVEIVRDGVRDGLRLVFEDHGPGIADIDRALEDGFSTGGSMGMGLPGARRLVDEFAVTSTVGVGTRVTIVRWKV